MTFDQAIAILPPSLAPLVRTHWEHYCAYLADAGLPLPVFTRDALCALVKTWAGSDYVAGQCARQPALLTALLLSGELQRKYAADEMRAHVVTAIASASDDDTLMTALRRVRHREMLRIIWRDLAAGASLSETVNDLSELADACIDLALEKITAWGERDLGVPIGEQSGTPQKLVVLGMGKLGARELNLSSDVDLIFAYPEEGDTQGMPKVLSNHEFFTRLGRRLIKVLDAVTADGFVFRVDMRLRPWGSSGALACSFDALESYYEEQGRPWERYAMIKARVCAGDMAAGGQLLQRLGPFVYRRYMDFSAFESLRELKGMIIREVKRKGMEANVKLGPGGIREVEFIAQAFQLIRGGVDKRLQERALLPVLATLAELGVIDAAMRDDLAAANDFLRRTEHRLQAIADAQKQTLPEDDITRLRVAFAMGFDDWPAFLHALDIHRATVEKHFRDVVALPGEAQGAADEAGDEWLDLWLGRLPEPAALALLAATGIVDGAAILAALNAFREDRSVAHLQAIARERLDRLMPALLRGLERCIAPAAVLPRVLKVFAAVLRRSVYMVLLSENPQALAELLRLCGASEWIADEIARHPSLLDELLNTGTLYAPPQLVDLRADLRAQLARIALDDTEQLMETLRHFRLAHVLKVAASDVMGTLPLMKVSDYLTWIAEAVLGEVLEIAWHNVAAKHGCPRDIDGNALADPAQSGGFAIIAYGKLGGIELSYGSDLDLVFLYDAPPDGTTGGVREIANEEFYTRLVQRIINLLTTRTFSGELYEVDMRLRPSGASGLLVSSVDAFVKYQRESAWTWEHQALVRARPVAGDPAVAARFDAIRRETLVRRREAATLQSEVVAMRDKMIAHLGLAADASATAAEKAVLFDIKHDAGGIVDIEFLVQYLVLRWACEHPELIRYTDNVRQLEGIAAAGLLSACDADLLRQAYLAFRTRTHQQALAKEKSRVDATGVAQQRATVRRIWQMVFGDTAAGSSIH
ncbi:MAG: bifunctional [glutamate--ammonia ligase]-adenylyl-L-tyrosine phosphorylase/[glutamate--ammonia-ligase] adenylyltransferase [Pseudomonadota bacterium]